MIAGVEMSALTCEGPVSSSSNDASTAHEDNDREEK